MTDTVIVIVGAASSGLTVAGAVWAVLKWYHRQLVRAVSEGVAAQLVPVKRELTPNGGSSMKDAVNEIRSELTEHRQSTRQSFNEVHRRIDRLYGDRSRAQ